MTLSGNSSRRVKRSRNPRRVMSLVTTCLSLVAGVASAEMEKSLAFDRAPNNINNRPLPSVKEVSTRLKELKVGFFYGIQDDLLKSPPRAPRLSEIMSETLDELRVARAEIETLRQEVLIVQRQQREEDTDDTEGSVDQRRGRKQRRLLARRK